MRIVIAGGSGFIGRSLASRFKELGHDVVVLSRSGTEVEGTQAVKWNGESLGEWAKLLDGSGAVINLSGEPVTLPWTPENRTRILQSRVKSTEVLGQAIRHCRMPPPVWINSSACGYYGDQGDKELDETSPAGEGFLAETCLAWERAVDEADTPSTRKAKIRTGIVLGTAGGAFPELEKFTRQFMGGRQGSGRQWMSWIHIHDLVSIYLWVLENPVQGPINGVGPEPIQNREFMFKLRHILDKPWSPPAPEFALRLVGKLKGVQADVVLQSQRVVSKVLRDAEFKYRYPTLEAAFEKLLGKDWDSLHKVQ